MLEMCSESTFLELIQQLGSSIEVEGIKNIVNVDRSNVLDGGFRAFGRTSLNPRRWLSVKFAGEDGLDAGGLSREFIRLALEFIQTLRIFVGPDFRKSPTSDYKG
jgi:hypothetical protein